MPKQDSLNTFANQCEWAWIIYSEMKTLSEVKGDDLRNLKEFADAFLGEMQVVLHEYLLLLIYRLIDKPFWKNRQGQLKENLTLDNMIATLPLPPQLQAELVQESKALKKIVKPVVKARNKIIGHCDKATALMNHRLGRTEEGAFDKFFEVLESMLKRMYAVVNRDPKPENNPVPYTLRIPTANVPVSNMIVKLRMWKREKAALQRS